MSTPITGRDRDEWIDRTTAATLAGCAIDTIRRDQRDHALPTRTGPNASTLLLLGDLIDIGRIPPAVLDPATTARQVAEAAGLRRQLTDLQIAHAELRGQTASLGQTISDLREHIATLTAYCHTLTGASATGGHR